VTAESLPTDTMAITINVNNLSLCHKGSGGISTATVPDVCKTPSPGGPVPIPYPNIAMSGDLAKGTTTVVADGGNMCANYGSEFSKSTGDEAGNLGGVASGTFIKEATWITYSFDVKLEGQGACRLTDKMFHNHQNTVNAAGELQIFVLGDKVLNLACNIFCKVLKKRKNFKARNPDEAFKFSKECEELAQKQYAKELAEVGLKTEERALVRIADKGLLEAVEKAGREVLGSEKVAASLARLGADTVKAGAEIGAEAVVGAEVGAEVGAVATVETGPGAVAGAGGGGLVGGVIGGVIAIANVVMDAYLIKDLAEAGSQIVDVVLTSWKEAQAVEIIPDLAVAGKSGEVTRMLDFKGPGDRFRRYQKEIMETGTGQKVDEVSLKSCNGCKEV